VNEVFRAAADLQAFCDAQGWRQALIGGLAVLRWGEPRETVDVDLTLLTGLRDEGRLIRLLLDRYRPRIPNAAEFPGRRVGVPGGARRTAALGRSPRVRVVTGYCSGRTLPNSAAKLVPKPVGNDQVGKAKASLLMLPPTSP
jgi:hypothetical protein